MSGSRKKWIIRTMGFDLTDTADRKEYRRFKRDWTRMSVPDKENMIDLMAECDAFEDRVQV